MHANKLVRKRIGIASLFGRNIRFEGYCVVVEVTPGYWGDIGDNEL